MHLSFDILNLKCAVNLTSLRTLIKRWLTTIKTIFEYLYADNCTQWAQDYSKLSKQNIVLEDAQIWSKNARKKNQNSSEIRILIKIAQKVHKDAKAWKSMPKNKQRFKTNVKTPHVNKSA